MSPKAVLVYNPGSGKGKAKGRAIIFQKMWQDKYNEDILLRATKSKEDIKVAAKEFEEKIIILMGGDGTISEGLQGLSEKENHEKISNPVGILPAGSGNSFLRDFGVTTFESAAERLLNAIYENRTRPIDMGVIEYKANQQKVSRVFCNIFGIGLVPHIADQAMKMRKIGPLNYIVASLMKIFKHKPYEIEVIVDGVLEKIKSDFISICNSKYTGGAMIMAPNIEVDDGKLYFVSSLAKSKMDMIKLFPTIFKGTHLQNEAVRHHYIQQAHIKSKDELLLLIDGEIEKGYDPLITVKQGYWKLYI